MVPAPLGPMVQLTEVLLVLATVVMNCWLCPAERLAVAGLTAMVTGGINVMMELADWVGFATLVAVTVTVCRTLMLAGAV